MAPAPSSLPFHELVTIADCLLEECGEDEDALVRRLQTLDPDIVNELIVSDLLNAWQVFYFFFRTVPEEIIRERLDLEPASALVSGILVDEIDLLELRFAIKNNQPYMYVSDGDTVLATFSGNTAYQDARAYIESTL
ncbi:MAG: hypothetical protein WC391_04850 [Methanoregula sp.]